MHISDMGPPDGNASALIVDVDKLEQNLSDLEARWQVAIGAVVLPAQPVPPTTGPGP